MLPDLKFAAYFNGAAGDVTIWGYKGYFVSRKREGKSHEEAMQYAVGLIEELGEKIAQRVIDEIDAVPVEPITHLHVNRRFIFPRVGRIKSIWQRMKYYKTLDSKIRLLMKEARDALRIGVLHDLYKIVNGRYLPMLNIIKNGRRVHHQTEIFVAQINDITWFSAPGEPFIRYQKSLFEKLPNNKGFFSQMNETCGYIYPWSFYVKGGYEKFFSFDALFGRYMHQVFAQQVQKIKD